MSQIKVRDEFGEPVILVNIRISELGKSSDEAFFDVFTDFAGNTGWPIPYFPNRTFSLHINYNNILDDFISLTQDSTPTNADGDIEITLHRSAGAGMERVHIEGYYAKTASGKDFFYAGETGFLDLYRVLRGENITSLLERSSELGSIGRRNFLMTYNTGNTGGIGPQEPDMYGNGFFDALERMLEEYQKYRLYLYASVFPDNKLFPNWRDQTSKQVNHWNRLGDIAKRYSNFFALELTNEIDAKDYNEVDRNAFNKIDGVICCSGSMGSTGGNPMSSPQWDICDFHQPRQYPNSVVDSCVANHPSRLQQGKALLLGEPVGFGDKALNNNREDNPRIAKEIAGTAIGTACGIIFHSQHGGFSQPYDSIENACAETWFNTLRGVI